MLLDFLIGNSANPEVALGFSSLVVSEGNFFKAARSKSDKNPKMKWKMFYLEIGTWAPCLRN